MTVKQKQCLLYYLGYYTGGLDGIWGNQSRAATTEFQEATGLTADGVFGHQTEERIREAVAGNEFKTVTPVVDSTGDSWWSEIKYFTRAEFACKCGGRFCQGYPAEPVEQLVRLLDGIREHYGVPVIVSSGLRCKQHNSNSGGVSNSRHLSGKAVDFCVGTKSSAEVLAYVLTLPGVRYAYAIDGSFVHMDVA